MFFIDLFGGSMIRTGDQRENLASKDRCMKTLLVYNGFAGHKRAGKILPEVEAGLVRRGIDFDLARTDYPEHAVSLVKEADLGRYDGLIAAGGDGTLFEVINGYFQNPSKKKIPLGILPVGTGNAFARDMDFDVESWEAAADIIAAGQIKNVDVGRFNTHGQDYYFLNILGLGFVADVGKTARRLKIFGNIAYTIGVFYQIIFLKSFPVRLTADGNTFEGRDIFIEISNTRYTSNFFMAPGAQIDDGYLDVTILRKASRRRLVQCFPKIFTGEHIHMKEMEHFKAKKITIETEKPKVLTPDGELMGTTPITVDCLKQAVPMFWK
jgi:diacylglycerol kinase (ATP)